MLKVCVIFVIIGVACGQNLQFPDENIPLSPGIPLTRQANNIGQSNAKVPKHRYTPQTDERPATPILPKTPVVPLRSTQVPDEEEEEFLRKQAESAQYTYGSQIKDGIMDGQVTREETRDGLKVEGMYSYSDGFFMRTVHYAADENGYRVINEEIVPIGDGPIFDPKGKADISTSLAGSYSITGDDIRFSNNLRHKDDLKPLRERQ